MGRDGESVLFFRGPSTRPKGRAEGHGTAHSLEKQLHYQQRKEPPTILEKGKKSG